MTAEEAAAPINKEQPGSSGRHRAAFELPCLLSRPRTFLRRRVLLRDLPIRCKLMMLILVAGSIAVVIESSLFLVYQSYVLHRVSRAAAGNVTTSLLADAAPALARNDSAAIRKALSALAVEPDVRAAWIVNPDGQLIALYHRPGLPPPSPVRLPDGEYFHSHVLTFSRSIFLSGRRLGSITLAYSLTSFEARERQHRRIGAILLLISLFLRLIVAMQLTRIVTRPVVSLAGLAQRISVDHDYSLRAPASSRDEIGLLINSFNEMLARIESNDRARKSAEQRLRQSEERYALAARGANDGLWDYDNTTGLAYISPRLNAMYGEPEAESWMTMEDWVGRIHPADRARVYAEIEACYSSDRPTLQLEYRARHADGSYRWMLSHGAVVRDQNGKVLRTAGSQHDITESKTTDPLTGLANRLSFIDALGELLQRDTQLAVLFMDLNGFTLIVESLGHSAGDDILAQVAARLRSLARTNPQWLQPFIAHCGEDEFAVLLSGSGYETEALILAARILETLREPFFIDQQRVAVTASIGIAYPSPADSPEQLLHNAETAMYHAFTQGRSQFSVFRPDMRSRTSSRLEILTSLRRAIDAGQLVLHYQPVVSMRRRKIVGFESLVRWQHPERGLIGPGEFIPAAEESDLILDIGHWVLREASRQVAHWHRLFAFEPPLSVSVNLSARQLNDPSIVHSLRSTLVETRLDPRFLRLEITETSLIGNSDQALATFREIRKLRVGLVIDDFGTGYSSLSYLQRLPFGVLKIDRSFVRDLGAGGGSPEIIRTILLLARSLRMRVIAEGVETAAQASLLAALGCDLIQGFYFGRPASAVDTESRLRDCGVSVAIPTAQPDPVALLADESLAAATAFQLAAGGD